jgi:hypothetical protein
MGGPLYLGPLHNRTVAALLRELVDRSAGSGVIASGRRLAGLLMLLGTEV